MAKSVLQLADVTFNIKMLVVIEITRIACLRGQQSDLAFSANHYGYGSRGQSVL